MSFHCASHPPSSSFNFGLCTNWSQTKNLNVYWTSSHTTAPKRRARTQQSSFLQDSERNQFLTALFPINYVWPCTYGTTTHSKPFKSLQKDQERKRFALGKSNANKIFCGTYLVSLSSCRVPIPLQGIAKRKQKPLLRFQRKGKTN